MNSNFWRGKRVLVTGHTGFKGGWLSLWLNQLGALIHGYSLPPPTKPNIFTEARVQESLASSTLDTICNPAMIHRIIQETQPEIVFHMAAQPLVRHSYAHPMETYATNVMGTVNLLEAIRTSTGIRVVVIVTTDKCYENREWMWGYRENEPLGGFDPYSSSKACAELITSAYRSSYFEKADIALASVRTGNVIGGGDWAADRLIPDFWRAQERGETLKIRSPEAIRPWQHVLDPLAGYLLLVERLYEEGSSYAEAWNFGPVDAGTKSVRWIIEQLVTAIPGVSWESDPSDHPHETYALRLDSSKAAARLGWRPRWNLETALAKTLEWYIAWRRGVEMRTFTLDQIAQYETEGKTHESLSV